MIKSKLTPEQAPLKEQMLSRFFMIVFFLIIFFSCKNRVDQVLVRTIEASSALDADIDPSLYHSFYMFDENPKTSWCARDNTSTIQVVLDEFISFNALRIRKGKLARYETQKPIKKITLKVYKNNFAEKPEVAEVSLLPLLKKWKQLPKKPIDLPLGKEMYGKNLQIILGEKEKKQNLKSKPIYCLSSIGFGNKEEGQELRLMPILFKKGPLYQTPKQFFKNQYQVFFEYTNQNRKNTSCVLEASCHRKRFRIQSANTGKIKFGFPWEKAADQSQKIDKPYYIVPSNTNNFFVHLDLHPMQSNENGINYQVFNAANQLPEGSLTLQWDKSKGLTDARELLKGESFEDDKDFLKYLDKADIVYATFNPEKTRTPSKAVYILY